MLSASFAGILCSDSDGCTIGTISIVSEIVSSERRSKGCSASGIVSILPFPPPPRPPNNLRKNPFLVVLFSEDGTLVVLVMVETMLALSGITMSGTVDLLFLLFAAGWDRIFIILRKRSGVFDRGFSGVL